MDRKLSEVLKQICNEYEIDPELEASIIKKLHGEFYFKLKDVKNLSLDMWKSFGLPANLYFIVNELYQSAFQQNSQSIPEERNVNWIQPQPQQQQSQKQMSQQVTTNEIKQSGTSIETSSIQSNQDKLKAQSHGIISNPTDLESHFHNVLNEINSPDIATDVFRLIHNVLTNITQNPNDEKFKKINIQKWFTKYNYISIQNLWQFIGFKKVDEFMYWCQPPETLNSTLPQLNKFLIQSKLVKSQFNPYQSSFASWSSNVEKISEISKQANFDELYNQEVARRNEIIKNTLIVRSPKAYQITSNFGMNNIMQMKNEKEEDEDVGNDKEIYKQWMEIIKENSNNRFTMKSRVKFESLINTPVYVKSDIRLKFPENYILEASFGLNETIGDINSFVNNYWNNKNNKFSISTTPPPKRYSNEKQTIKDCQLFPQVWIYVNFEGEYNGINEEMVNLIKVNIE